ncbi:MAG: SGNH/GDSL hydrolase family protein [Bacteroidetes bacterium]|nr:MAG: SGNH/GDSL hydrolase family protein [Bacteroidota bacterium]
MGTSRNIDDSLIRQLLSGELGPEAIGALEAQFDQMDRFDFRTLVKRIFDLNDDYLLNQSTCDKGLLGRMNKIGKRIKNKRFIKKLKKGSVGKIIVAEGDSWFEYPLFIRDIVDWMIRLTDYSVYSIASGGDWISNILYTGDYITELSIYRPDVFLISGGGNDLVDDNRLAILVKKRKEVDLKMDRADRTLLHQYLTAGMSEELAKKLVIGRKFLTREFWGLLNVFRFQYYLIFKNIRSNPKFDSMKIITQGYDYPIPSSNRNIFKNPLRLLFKNGHWLDTPLRIRGITAADEKKSILATMIYEFNEMLIQVGARFKNIYHIDCRGMADANSWNDELHLKSENYKAIAQKYIECIECEEPAHKVFAV